MLWFTSKKTTMKLNSTLVLVILSTLLISCGKQPSIPTQTIEPGMADLVIPNQFNFETTKAISLTIKDSRNSSYDVYSITKTGDPEVIITETDTLIDISTSNQKIASGRTVNGSLQIQLNVPGHQEHLYIRRKVAGKFYGEMITANEGQIEYTNNGNLKSTNGVIEDVIYGVNSNGQAFSFDIETGVSTLLTNFNDGAFANAIDKANNKMYVAIRKPPFKLISIDLTSGTQTDIGNLNKQYDRMVYDAKNGLLYLGKKNRLYSYDPFSGQYINEYILTGSNANLGGGDVSLSADGTFYFTSSSKTVLYKGKIEGNKIPTTTITNSLSAKTTSSTLGSDGYLYYATNNTPSKVYKVNVQTGSDQLLYTLSAYKANDFGILLKDNEQQEDDADGDGVPDTEDDYPNDPSLAYNLWVPGENQWGTLAFEDLWPGMGDYDFNDMVVNYKFQQIANSENKIVSIKGYIKNVHEGASLVNGFGFELPIGQNLVSSVNGNNITDNTVNISGNGTEAQQTNAVIIVYDNGDVNLNNLLTVDVTFTQPLAQTSLGNAPYNPFIIKDQDRNFEIHLPDHEPTDLANINHLGTFHDNSNPAIGRYYKTQENLPWAINIPIEFVWPKEKSEILKAYLKFKIWAESGGTQYPDWYLDENGYRDEAFLDI